MRYIIVIGIFFYFIVYLFGIRFDHEKRIEEQCREYEYQKVIPENSCDCTLKLFKTWEESYDWKDSCAILEHR